MQTNVQLFDAEAAYPLFVWQLLAAFVTDAVAALDTHVSRVEQPEELLGTARALLRRVVMATACHCAHAQLSHVSLDLTVYTTRTFRVNQRRRSLI